MFIFSCLLHTVFSLSLFFCALWENSCGTSERPSREPPCCSSDLWLRSSPVNCWPKISLWLTFFSSSLVNKFQNAPAPLYHGTTVPHYHCTTLPLYHRTTVPRYHCTSISLYHCSMVPRYHCTTVLLYHGTTIPLHHYTTVPQYHCTTVPLYCCTRYHSTTVSLYLCTTVPVYLSLVWCSDPITCPPLMKECSVRRFG